MNNVTSKAFHGYYKYYIDDYNCQDYFNFNQDELYSVKVKICDSPNLTISNYTALSKWMEALLVPDPNFPNITTDAQKYIIQNINSLHIDNWETLERYL